MKQPSEITGVSPEALTRWEQWFNASFEAAMLRMLTDKENPVFKALQTAMGAAPVKNAIDSELDALRSEIAGRKVVAALTGDRL